MRTKKEYQKELEDKLPALYFIYELFDNDVADKTRKPDSYMARYFGVVLANEAKKASEGTKSIVEVCNDDMTILGVRLAVKLKIAKHTDVQFVIVRNPDDKLSDCDWAFLDEDGRWEETVPGFCTYTREMMMELL